MNTLIFDTETSGLIPKGAKYDTHYAIFPHIVQLAWLYNDTICDYMIRPQDYIIPKESTEIHGISHKKALKDGVSLNYAIAKFLKDCSKATTIIGHNIYFDTSIIKANVIRSIPGAIDSISDALYKSKRICTMTKSMKYCGFKQPGTNRLKFPSLLQLYYKLFGETFAAHNAAEDVIATKRCYDELVRIGII